MQEMLRKPRAYRQEGSSSETMTTSLKTESHTTTTRLEEKKQLNDHEVETRKREEEKRRLSEKQKDEADCIALRLIAEQMASESNLSKETATNFSNAATSSKMQSFISLRSESSSLSQQLTPQTIPSNCKVEVINKAITSQEDIGSSKEETDSSCNGEEIFYQATTTASSHVKEEPPPLPPKARGSTFSPSPSSQSQPSPSFSDETITSQSTIRTGQYIRVREKVVQLERKLEEDALKLEEEEEGGTPRAGVRPENLVGAVRLLPTPTPPNSRPASQASSRKSSLTRSSSMEGNARHGLLSPTTVGGLHSPAFARRHLDTPPLMYRSALIFT